MFLISLPPLSYWTCLQKNKFPYLFNFHFSKSLVKFINHLHLSTSNGQFSIFISIDISAAFSNIIFFLMKYISIWLFHILTSNYLDSLTQYPLLHSLTNISEFEGPRTQPSGILFVICGLSLGVLQSILCAEPRDKPD